MERGNPMYDHAPGAGGRPAAPFGPDLPNLQRWLLVAMGSLILAGALALALVVGRVPPLSSFFTDAQFFKRCLVVHVDLALVIWFYAFLAALMHLLPGRVDGTQSRIGSRAALLGMMLMVAAAAVATAEPVLANYVPVIDHPVFLIGLGLVAIGVVAGLVQRRLLPPTDVAPVTGLLPPAAHPFLRAAALAFLIALTCFWGAWLATRRDLPVATYYEFLMWGGGHVLQFSSVAAMLAVWLALLQPMLAAPVLRERTASALATVLTLPLLVAPLLAWQGTDSALYRSGFTRLMEFGIFPVVTVVLLACVRALRRARRAGSLPARVWRDWRFLSFAVSAALTVTGFLLGAAISGSNTVVPAHYHAAIGAVTAAFMAATYILLPHLGMPLRGVWLPRLAAWQVPLFGAGQLVFAIGFAMAGAHGAARKAYAHEQQVRTLGEAIGLGVMGVGGLLAAIGGLLFLGLIIAAGRRAAVPWTVPLSTPASRQGEAYGE